jgi:non-homologous end joining protein Ku
MSESFHSMSNTAILFGPFPIPVKIYSAPQKYYSSGVSTHMCHEHDDGHGYKINMPTVCSECGDVVPRSLTRRTLDKPTKDNKKLKILTDEEVAALKGDSEGDIGKELQVLHFVHADEVKPTMCDTVRYLDPDKVNKLAEECYAALWTMLDESRLVAVVQFALRGTPHLAVIQPVEDGVLIIQNVIWLREFAVKKVTPNLKFVKMMTEFAQTEMADGFGSPEYITNFSITPVMPVSDDDTDTVPEDVADLVAKLERVVKTREQTKPRRTRKTKAAA